MSDSLDLVRVRYRSIRKTAFDRALARLHGILPTDAAIRLTEITGEAVAVWRTVWQPQVHPSGVAWPWDAIAERCARKPKLFHLGIWDGDTLCGLAVGHLSARNAEGFRRTISLDRVAGSPDPAHPLRGAILPISFIAATEFGYSFGATRLRLMEPLPGMVERYEALGFTVVRKRSRVLYCEREI